MKERGSSSTIRGAAIPDATSPVYKRRWSDWPENDTATKSLQWHSTSPWIVVWPIHGKSREESWGVNRFDEKSKHVQVFEYEFAWLHCHYCKPGRRLRWKMERWRRRCFTSFLLVGHWMMILNSRLKRHLKQDNRIFPPFLLNAKHKTEIG